MSLINYAFRQAGQFLQAPGDHWKAMNFRGEVYEAAFYEFMLGTQDHLARDGVKLVAKGPYAVPSQSLGGAGFRYDGNGTCLYMESGLSLAEFDCMTISSEEVRFYECTMTRSRPNLKTLKAEALRKLTLLQALFPKHKVACTVVCDAPGTAAYFATIAGVNSIIFNPELPELVGLAKRSGLQRQTAPPGLATIDALNAQAAGFSYLDEVARRSLQLPRQATLAEMRKLNGNGLFPRLYWGHIAAQGLAQRVTFAPNEPIIVGINFPKRGKAVLRYYYVNRLTGDVYEALNPPKKLTDIKASRAEIIKVCSELQPVELSALRALEAEIEAAHLPVNRARVQ